VTNLL